MSQQEVDSFFIEQLHIVLEYWQMEADGQDQAVLNRLDRGRQNLFHIVNLGLEHSYTQTAAAQLALAVFPLVEQRGYWSEWVPVLERAIELQGTESSSLLFHLLNRLGQLYRWERKIDLAIEAHKSAETAARQLSDEHALANAWFNLSEDYNQIREFSESEKYGLMALEAFEELDADEKWIAAVYNSLGTNALYGGRLETAEARLRQAVTLSRNLDDSVRLARMSINLANVLRAEKKFDEALYYFENAGNLLDKDSQTLDQASAQIALGGIYNDLDQLTNARSAYRKALALGLNELGYTYYQAYALQGLGNVLLRMELFEEAEPILDNAIDCWQDLSDEINLVNSLGTLAETKAAQQKPGAAAQLYRRAIALVEKHQDDPFGQVLFDELTSQLEEIKNGSLQRGDF